MEAQLREVLADTARLAVPIDTLALDTDLHASGLSSMATVNVMLGIEEKFDIEFPENLLKRETFQSIRSLLQVVCSLQQKQEETA